MMKNKLKEVELKDGDVVEFVPATEKYGRAEFSICPVWKYGKLRKMYIYPLQQEDTKNYYVINCDYGALDWTAQSWSHKGVEKPWVWLNGWCKEHKAPFVRLYVPKNSTRFSVSVMSQIGLEFDL